MYLSDAGKSMHDKSPEADKFIYQGPITAKKQAEEEEAAETAANQGKEDDNDDESIDRNLKAKVKREAKELGEKDLEDATKGKHTKLDEFKDDNDDESKRKKDADKLKDK